MPSERAPSDAEVLRRAIAAALADVHKSIPATVTKWDPAKQRVDVKIGVKMPYLDEEDARQVESVPIIPSVPLMFPGASSSRVTFPISDGSLVVDGKTIRATTGALYFCDRSIDRWLAGSGQEVDPEIDHTHALPDAFFVPGLNPFGAALGDVPTDHITIGFDGGLQIHIRGTTICIGDESGSNFLALANLVATQLNTMKSAISGAAVVAQDGGAAFKANILAALGAWPGSVAATEAKGK